MDVDSIVAWWLNKCLQGEMTAKDLLAALEELHGKVQSAPTNTRRRLTALTRRVRAALASGDLDQARIESLAVEFLGTHPSTVLDARGAPDWHYER